MTSVMARRVLLGQLLAARATSPTVLAQARRARVGYLSLLPLPTAEARTLSESLLLGALRVKGWSEPANLVLESRGPATDKTLAAAAAELVAVRPAVLASGGTPAGVAWRLDELIPKTLSLLLEMVPRARRVDLVNQAGDPGHGRFGKVMVDAARARGLASQALQVKDADELVAAISGSAADALLLVATQMIYRRPERIA